jgi:Protein of unknown function (DUF4242)
MSAKTYLLEAYLSKSVADGPAGTADRAALAAQEMQREGTPVRYLRSIFIPQDETCFHIFEARSEKDVRDAAERAGIRAERVLETTTLDACNDRAWHTDRLLKEER